MHAFLFVGLMVFASCSPRAYDFSFFAMGDMPYYYPDDYSRLDRLITSLNDENPAFTVHVGDFKSGSSPCSDEYFLKMQGYFRQFMHPLFYTPGDNEWTDCHRQAAGGFVAEERLDKVRELFYTQNETLIDPPFSYNSQSANDGYSEFVENAIWDHRNITFGTLHVVGSNNNFKTDSTADNSEFMVRDVANQFWLEKIFQQAKSKNSDGIAIFLHAGLNYEDSEKNGFNNFTKKLREEVMGYDKPILMVYGDHHRFLIEKPLVDDQGKVLKNFTSLMVFGDKDMHAVEICVDKDDKELFLIRQFFVEGN